MEDQHDLMGVHGWLRFLVIIMMFLAPLVFLTQTYSSLQDIATHQPILASNPLWYRYKAIVWTLTFIAVTTSIAGGYRLWKVHRPSSVWVAAMALWVCGPGATAIGVMVAFLTLKAVHPNLLDVVNKAFVWAAIWTGYLYRSIRVKNTYSLFR